MIKVLKQPRVTLLARQEFVYPAHIDWESDSEVAAEVLSEFAGRLCYLSFGEGNLDGHQTINGRPRNSDYLANIIDVKHGSVLEHAVFSVLIEGVSRSLTHELVRHRAGFGFSQLSQRYVDESSVAFVLPPEIREGSTSYGYFMDSCMEALTRYRQILRSETEKLEGTDEKKTMQKKRARQAARAVLPNAAETKIVVTGNVRAWRHFIEMRAAAPADMEIRRLAVEVLRVLQLEAPNMFADYRIQRHTDGTEVVTTEHAKV